MAEMAIYTRADGLLEPRSDRALEYVRKHKPGTMILFSAVENQRSAKQNRYLNGWIYFQLAKALNDGGITLKGMPWTRDTLHAMFQDLFLVKMECWFAGKEFKIYWSTANMSKKRFKKYVDEQIRPFAKDMWDIDIPEPEGGFYAELLRDINSKNGEKK